MTKTNQADRKPIIWAVSVSRLQLLFHKIIPSYSSDADIQVIDKGFDEALDIVQELMRTQEVDVLVSAGANGAYLRTHVDIPVILVKVGGFDVLYALSKARERSSHIAIVTYGIVHQELKRFEALFDLNIKQRSYKTADDAGKCVSELAHQGIEVIIGPGLVTELAEQAGLIGIFLYSKSSVREALDHAIELARVARTEEARRERLNTILRSLDEGVVAVDMQECIQTLNPAMERLLGISGAQGLGRRLSEIAPGLGLKRTLKNGNNELEVIQRIGSRTIVTNRIPILEQGAQTGAVLSFHDSTAIQRVERNIRSKTRPHHFLAKYKLSDLVGDSKAFSHARSLAEKYAKTDATVLIGGESGTGKELLAQGIHNASRRKHHRFVAINCAAFPESLLESELFGYEQGAFSGSRQGGKTGLVETAHTGTLFLDEVGDMPIALQTRLLRVLQEKEVLRLGSNEPTPVDVRVIAATNQNLRESIVEGEFRQDLFYRLNILAVQLPPLRQRPEDLPALSSHLLNQILHRHHSKRTEGTLLQALLPYFQDYPWPGNVRELENIIERSVVFYSDLEPDQEVDEGQLRSLIPEIFDDTRSSIQEEQESNSLRAISRSSEINHILKTLEHCGGNQAAACKRLGIGRTTLWRKLNAKR
ncbi:MAG: propionate catabolism operon regulatory protein PrpR [Gammaproteobacteria bacterium]|nr:propionate catabolism operon regulatory protein PrpR [Gammaproteobacteria bacterium]